MKICFVSPAAYPIFSGDAGANSGGAEAQLVTLGRELAAKGHDVSFVVDDFGQGGVREVDGISIYRSKLRYMGGSNLYLLPDWYHFWKVLKRIGADIHFIKVPRNLLLPLALYARMHGKKALYIGQRDVDVTREGVLSSDNRISYWFYRSGLFIASGVVAQTEFQKRLFMSSFSKQATVIKNVLTLTPDTEKVERSYVLWVGNSSVRKQPEMFVELARALPDIQFKMIMSISSERADDAFIREPAEELDNLDYVGALPFQEMAARYNGAQLFVSTSLSEGFPNTFLQSWLHAVPVVSLCIDPDDVTKKYQLGRLSGSFEKMVDDVAAIMKDQALAQRLGVNGKNYVDKEHSLASSVSAYEKMFRHL